MVSQTVQTLYLRCCFLQFLPIFRKANKTFHLQGFPAWLFQILAWAVSLFLCHSRFPMQQAWSGKKSSVHTSAKAKGELTKKRLHSTWPGCLFSFAAMTRIKRIVLLFDVAGSGPKALSGQVLCHSLKLINNMWHELWGFTGVGGSVGSSPLAPVVTGQRAVASDWSRAPLN